MQCTPKMEDTWQIVKWLLFTKTFENLISVSTNTDKYYFVDDKM